MRISLTIIFISLSIATLLGCSNKDNSNHTELENLSNNIVSQKALTHEQRKEIADLRRFIGDTPTVSLESSAEGISIRVRFHYRTDGVCEFDFKDGDKASGKGGNYFVAGSFAFDFELRPCTDLMASMEKLETSDVENSLTFSFKGFNIAPGPPHITSNKEIPRISNASLTIAYTEKYYSLEKSDEYDSYNDLSKTFADHLDSQSLYVQEQKAIWADNVIEEIFVKISVHDLNYNFSTKIEDGTEIAKQTKFDKIGTPKVRLDGFSGGFLWLNNYKEYSIDNVILFSEGITYENLLQNLVGKKNYSLD